MKDLSLMTWKEVKAVDKEKSIAFIVFITKPPDKVEFYFQHSAILHIP